jgi:hypothetical protein
MHSLLLLIRGLFSLYSSLLDRIYQIENSRTSVNSLIDCVFDSEALANHTKQICSRSLVDWIAPFRRTRTVDDLIGMASDRQYHTAFHRRHRQRRHRSPLFTRSGRNNFSATLQPLLYQEQNDLDRLSLAIIIMGNTRQGSP